MEIKISEIKDADLNPRITVDEDYIKDLAMSIGKHGLLSPIIVSKNKKGYSLVIGNCRLAAVKLLGWKTISAIISTKNNTDNIISAIEENIKRQDLTLLEKLMAIKKLKDIGYTDKQISSAFSWSAGYTFEILSMVNDINDNSMCDTLKEEISTPGSVIGATHYTQLRKIKDKPVQEKIVERVIKHGLSMRETKKLVISHLGIEKLKRDMKYGDYLKDLDKWLNVWNVWNVPMRDKRFGFEYPGVIPGQYILNLLYYFTNEDDLIVDCFGGSGTTYDCCKYMKRKCLIYDIEPNRKEIKKCDITKGFPKEAKNCDMIIADPPYGSMKKEDYSKKSVSSLSLNEYYKFLNKFAKDCFKTVKTGGMVSVFMMEQTEKGLITNHPIHLTLNVVDAFRKAGFELYHKISVPMNNQCFSGYDVTHAKKEKRMLGILRELTVWKKGG